MGPLDLVLLLAACPALVLAALRIAHAFGLVEPVDLPAGALSPDALTAAAVLALAVFGSSAALSLRRIARGTRALVELGRSRDAQPTSGGETAVVDFAIHLDRRSRVDVRRPPGDATAGGIHPDAPGASSSRTLSELKSRLAHIPSVRGGGGQS